VPGGREQVRVRARMKAFCDSSDARNAVRWQRNFAASP